MKNTLDIIFSSGNENKHSSPQKARKRRRGRSLKIEELESREMLDAGLLSALDDALTGAPVEGEIAESETVITQPHDTDSGSAPPTGDTHATDSSTADMPLHFSLNSKFVPSEPAYTTNMGIKGVKGIRPAAGDMSTISFDTSSANFADLGLVAGDKISFEVWTPKTRMSGVSMRAHGILHVEMTWTGTSLEIESVHDMPSDGWINEVGMQLDNSLVTVESGKITVGGADAKLQAGTKYTVYMQGESTNGTIKTKFSKVSVSTQKFPSVKFKALRSTDFRVDSPVNSACFEWSPSRSLAATLTIVDGFRVELLLGKTKLGDFNVTAGGVDASGYGVFYAGTFDHNDVFSESVDAQAQKYTLTVSNLGRADMLVTVSGLYSDTRFTLNITALSTKYNTESAKPVKVSISTAKYAGSVPGQGPIPSQNTASEMSSMVTGSYIGTEGNDRIGIVIGESSSGVYPVTIYEDGLPNRGYNPYDDDRYIGSATLSTNVDGQLTLNITLSQKFDEHREEPVESSVKHITAVLETYTVQDQTEVKMMIPRNREWKTIHVVKESESITEPDIITPVTPPTTPIDMASLAGSYLGWEGDDRMAMVLTQTGGAGNFDIVFYEDGLPNQGYNPRDDERYEGTATMSGGTFQINILKQFDDGWEERVDRALKSMTATFSQDQAGNWILNIPRNGEWDGVSLKRVSI